MSGLRCRLGAFRPAQTKLSGSTDALEAKEGCWWGTEIQAPPWSLQPKELLLFDANAQEELSS